MADTTPAPIGADAALAQLVAAVEAETDQGWDCNSYHPSLWPALKAARTALASAAQPPAGIWVPTELAERVQETMGEFLMDHGWRQQDMDTSDEFGALLAAAPRQSSPMAEKQYPPLPAPDTHCFDEDTGKDVWSYSESLMRAYVDADRAMRHDELEHLCAEAYQVVGVLLDDTGQFNTEHACKILDNLSQMRRVHDDVLPWESVDMDAMRAAQAAPQPVEHPWVASDTMRADLIADLHDVFDTSGSETPQIVRDVIEYANSWLQVYIQKKAESPTQPAAPASQNAKDTASLDWLTFNLSGAALRAIGVEWPEHGDMRKAIDAARSKQDDES